MGAGTLLTPADVQAAKDARRALRRRPRRHRRLLDACEAADLPLLPGAATASEVMALLERGYSVQKFFPAEANGGAPALKAIGAPIPQVRFCPTGGVSMKNAATTCRWPTCCACGGSWVAPKAKMEAGDWDGIVALARAAAALPRS